MKRWIHSSISTNANRQVVITMNIGDADMTKSVAADIYLEHPENIKKKYRISDKHLQYLNDIIATFDHNLQAAGFDIIDRCPAGNSYSYYITFIPVTEDGRQLLPIDLIFRISDHSSKSAEASAGSTFARIVSFSLEHEDFDKASELIYEGIRIIQELKKGNADILDQI